MGYSLGVDLGTTFVAAAISNGQQPEMVTLGGRSVMIPSVVYRADDGHLLCGEAAVRRSTTEPDRVARGFKRRLGDPIPLRLGGESVPTTELLAALLREAVRIVTETEGAPPEQVVLTHPASWGPYRRGVFEEVPELAGLSEGPMVTEPAAAAIHYARSRNLTDGQVIAVYDLGGGTFDVTVLRAQPDQCEILGVPEGIEKLGGIDFDDALFAHIDHVSDGALSASDSHDPRVALSLARVRQDCTLAKENLSHDSDTVIPIFLPDRNFDIRVTREQFESLIRAQVESTVGALERTLRSAQIAPNDVDAVLLVGGSSRIPLISEMVSAALDRPTLVDTHPKYAVALGAAILAGRSAPSHPLASRQRPQRQEAADPVVEEIRAPKLEVVSEGRRVPVPADRPFIIGRGDEVQLALINSLVSRHHAVIERIGQDWTLADSSRNGTFIDGVRITQVKVTSPTRVLLGDKADGAEVELIPELLAAMPGPVYALGSPSDGKAAKKGQLTAVHSLTSGLLRIGRLPDNDVVLDDMLVSRRHAELRRTGYAWQLVDLDSGNGTFVNGRRINSSPVTPHDVIGVGSSLLQLDGDRLVECLDISPRDTPRDKSPAG